MANLAILGHASRGKEVIELLEMLGGKNDNHCCGSCVSRIYFLNDNDYIESYDSVLFPNYLQLTLEEFLEKFPYKVGDKVIADIIGKTEISSMKWSETENKVYYKVKGCDVLYTADCLQIYVEDMNIPEAMKQITDAAETLTASEEIVTKSIIKGDWVSQTQRIVFLKDAPDKTELALGDDFEVVEEDGKTYVVRKQPQYPKTYEECASIIGIEAAATNYIPNSYNPDLIHSFQKLLICRDAHWKIAGDWKPDWTDINSKKFIICSTQGKLERYSSVINSVLLAFPTAEMRDAFHKNFKELINECKELL